MSGRLLAPLLFAAAVLVLLAGTRRDLNEPHIRLFSDMAYSPAAKSQRENAVLPGGAAPRAPVFGTIPRGFTPFAFGPDQQERERAGRELKNPIAASYESLTRGKKVFDSFCAHCHGSKGRGDGPVARAYPMFSFPVASPSSYELKDGTLFHIITYGRNLMPAHRFQVTQEDRWMAVLYLRDLQRQEIARLGPLASLPEDPRRHALVSAAYGKELFAQNCAGCHGAEGRHPNPGIPTLNAPAVLAIADNDYYWSIITHGRPGTQMPAWRDVLSPTQTKSVIEYIRGWAQPVPERGMVAVAGGSARSGRSVYNTHCAGCHGPDGKGGIGISLNTPSFLAIASDQFLRDTIAMGRAHTAMPSSYDLKPSDISDLIAYMRSWTPGAPAWPDVSGLLASASAGEGRKVFAARCAGCHGEEGEGGIGSRLASDSFLPMVSDEFLYRVITQGRPGTEMPAWRFLPAKDLAGLIKVIRSWQKSPPVELSTGPVRGRAEFGEVLFKNECQKCHMPGGSGDLGMQIGNPVFGAQVSDQFLWRTIAYGKKGTEMKGFLTRKRDPLAEEDIGHIVAYVRKLQKNPPLEALRRTYSWADVKEGRKVFEEKGGCFKCHGLRAEGGSGPSLGAPGFQRVASAGFISATLVLGREGSEMKSYHKGGPVELTDDDVENVAAYLKTFENAPPEARRQVDRAAERVKVGRSLFRQSCAKCHGDQGQGKHGKEVGDFAPSLNNSEFLKAADDNFLLATIALGRPGTPMPPFALGTPEIKAISADDIRKIVAYIRSWEKRP